MKQVWIIVVIALATGSAQAAMFNGKVSDENGKSLLGAIVNFTDAQGTSQAVYTDDKGAYHVNIRLKGNGKIQVRKRYHEDVMQVIDLRGGPRN